MLSNELKLKMKNNTLLGEMAVCLYGDVVTENIHEHHSSKKHARRGQAFQLWAKDALISTQVSHPDVGPYMSLFANGKKCH